ncbi:MAG: tRNA threonylcarbamoyladenosine dehydratase [Eubacteriales bacterium]|nr:tRNA threonylcarbamoyladenosine dehydratase [Eubacteriales bacterium]MDD4422398.1 tRNA threonylcarbamoyladenosine dehydratase [Eubacteriales bacterium]
MNQFSRTELLLGKDSIKKLSLSRVAVFGIGGVGSYAAEALVRGGIGRIDLIDNDIVCLSNINRQIIATHSTLGKVKVDVMRERLLDINPDAVINTHKLFFDAESAALFDFTEFSYIVDAIDTVSSKLTLIECAVNADVPIISCMGAGNKLDPTMLEIDDIYKTSVCPLARVMRYELRKRGIAKLKVVYSKEKPIKTEKDTENDYETNIVCPDDTTEKSNIRKQVPGSVSFVPPVAGLIIAGEVIRDITGV